MGPGSSHPVDTHRLVFEATAYRYFPDLPSLLAEALEGTWPAPDEVLRPLADSTDAVQRVAHVTEFLLREVLARQGGVRAMMSASLLRPEIADKARPGHRFALIDSALAPLDPEGDEEPPEALTTLKRELAIIVSPEALLVLTDLCRLSPDDAIATAVSAAKKVTQATIREAVASSGSRSSIASAPSPLTLTVAESGSSGPHRHRSCGTSLVPWD